MHVSQVRVIDHLHKVMRLVLRLIDEALRVLPIFLAHVQQGRVERFK